MAVASGDEEVEPVAKLSVSLPEQHEKGTQDMEVSPRHSTGGRRVR